MQRSKRSTDRPEPRSAGTLATRRVPLPWPTDRDFRILSIDGGGIRGIFPAAFLAGLEARCPGVPSIAGYFDLIAGTSTGGIIALGLAANLSAAALRDLYVREGRDIFPPSGPGAIGRAIRKIKAWRRLWRYSYDQEALTRILRERLGDRKLADAHSRLCIPSFDGEYGEVYIFKTPHHPDFTKDRHETMVKVALATSAAPTFFRPIQDGGYTFIDGGIWANNPVMIGLTEALTSFKITREQIRILSIGCGQEPYTVTGKKITRGGMWHWRDLINAAMRLQSQNSLGQARLLIGPEHMIRVDVPKDLTPIELDDWQSAAKQLPDAAAEAVEAARDNIAEMFLKAPADPYSPIM
ncbi:MAG TPA: CBASS cGAMP-activated phospholipase [Xanthobacteraceae bacterium]|nr:CBASS cGAMP-activated phospholipase [Xanthobacteraceae bacterium]